MGKLKVTRDEYETFVNETSYAGSDKCFTLEDGKAEERGNRSFRNPGFDQDGKHPVVCINWDDANAYVAWLSKKTGKLYRLLSDRNGNMLRGPVAKLRSGGARRFLPIKPTTTAIPPMVTAQRGNIARRRFRPICSRRTPGVSTRCTEMHSNG